MVHVESVWIIICLTKLDGVFEMIPFIMVAKLDRILVLSAKEDMFVEMMAFVGLENAKNSNKIEIVKLAFTTTTSIQPNVSVSFTLAPVPAAISMIILPMASSQT